MFEDLADADLDAVIAKLRSAVIDLAAGIKVAEIRYGEMGRKFHPANPAEARSLLDSALAEKDRRAGKCRRRPLRVLGT